MNNKVLNMKLPEKLLKDINNLAKEKNISTSALVRIILNDYLEKNKRSI